MKKILELDTGRVEYTLRKNHRTKRLRLTVYADGRFLVSAPSFLSLKAIEKFVRQKASWVIEKIEMAKKNPAPILRRSDPHEYLQQKSAALKLARLKINQFNEHYNFKVNKITIRNQTTRWGSCSRSGNLNFNYKIALLPERSVDYIIVHELCHLGEFNHSPKFWKLVAKTIPDYLEIRKTLRNKMF